ncbi:spermidine/spermine N(1)-acetyltransferase-like protein 1 [Ursus arctos]|uniref:spermidine/spermine N(1)-acetyltransferase-like protein 1 n=1 Tax=Ursus arctos TaxID=9644 RepID=UPI002016FC94|nr:spermidine/spermine N(1)-acetyltransferase-like protein 1 [Ursus arctos]
MSQLGVNQSGMKQSSFPDVNQPGMSQPGTSLFGTNQLDINQPNTNLPDMNQLSMKQLGRCQPGRSQPGTWQPVMSQPGMSQFIISQSGTRQPGWSQSGISQAGTSQSGTRHPGMNQPSPSQPGIRQPGRSQSDMRQPSLNSFRVRPAEAHDCPEILRLIKELASCENMLDSVKLTVTDLLRDGFGDNPLFYCLIAEVHNQQKPSGKVTIGFAMYYFTYDPWIGKLLYLEDFYVTQAYRGLGIGAEMLKRLSQIAIRSQCNCMHFLVVVWNQASIDYYTRRGALDLSSEEGWHLFRFNRKELMHMAKEA